MISEIRYLGCCLPDYFQGYPGVVLAVSVWAGMTYAELKEGIDTESNSGDFGLDDWTGFDDALTELFNAVDPKAIADCTKGLEEEPEGYDGESVYAYFGIVGVRDD